jgi:hypothetical protein
MATVVSGWLSPLLLCASVLLMARSLYVIYVRKIATPTTVVTTWLALALMVGFWTWYLALGGSDFIRESFAPPTT